MTKDKDLKRLARERSQKTGESYSTARRQLIQKEERAPGDAEDEVNELMTPWLGLDSAAMVGAPLAGDEARVAGHPWVEPEHLLLGLLSEGTILEPLHAMRVSPVAVRHHVERALPAKRLARVSPTLSVGLLWALSLGREEAALRGERAASPADLLVALARLDRPVRDVLVEFGASERRLRDHLGYPDPPVSSVVRAAVVNRLLPLLGQSVVSMASMVGDVQVDDGGARAAVSIETTQAGLLVRLADDVRAAAESVIGTERQIAVNIVARE